jgi:hypothetical protein
MVKCTCHHYIFHQWGWWSVLVIIIYFTSEDGEVYLSSLYISPVRMVKCTCHHYIFFSDKQKITGFLGYFFLYINKTKILLKNKWKTKIQYYQSSSEIQSKKNERNVILIPILSNLIEGQFYKIIVIVIFLYQVSSIIQYIYQYAFKGYQNRNFFIPKIIVIFRISNFT